MFDRFTADAVGLHLYPLACRGIAAPASQGAISSSGVVRSSRARQLSDDEPGRNAREPWLTPRDPCRALPSHGAPRLYDAPLRRSRDARQLSYGFPLAFSLHLLIQAARRLFARG